ncbi:MAG: UvrD-helicase domain-containing protein [Rickettsiales bacterium]|nr:UvrD-helicase domain-containing protein [Rickettsiales bacterium]
MTYQTPSVEERLLVKHNPQQREAMQHIDGPLLVLAGAGTGKTLVLVNRIANIIAQNKAAPWQILAVTFTNKAANEMSERIFSLANQRISWLGTFHSIAAKILRNHAELVKLNSNFTILDVDDQLKMVKLTMEELNLDTKAISPKIIYSLIQQWKEKAITPTKLSNSDIFSDTEAQARKIYKAYQERMISNNVVDFGDLLLKNLDIFRESPEIVAKYHDIFKYILVDEYQDTNAVQYLWLRILAQQHHNICCVGDDDQSIYGWRGAEVGNILRFEQDFPNSKIVKLEQNYRSTNHILDAATTLISYNKNRYQKTLWTDTKSDEKIRIKSFWRDREESDFIASEIQNLTLFSRQTKIAILVRASFQTRVLEDSCVSHAVPYKIIGSLKFYERQEIKDIVAYIKLALNFNDDLAFERIINKPTRGIGKTSLQKLKRFAMDNGISFLSAAEQLIATGSNLLPKNALTSIGEFLAMIKKWRNDFMQHHHIKTLNIILEESGYKNLLEENKSEEMQNRKENVKELFKALEEFQDINAFLEHTSLISDNDQKSEDTQVNIMTLHAAKGLEFDVVFLPGWEEGIFPHSRSIEESGTKGLEEERRLAYVGMTRARKKLYITYSMNRRMYNQWLDSTPSRFLNEIPIDCCKI